MNRPGNEEIIAATNEAAELTRKLCEAGPPDRALFVLCLALQLLHAAAEPDDRAFIEERLRLVLTELYRVPPFEKLQEGATIGVHAMPRPRG